MTIDTYPVRSQYRSKGASHLVREPIDALLTVSADASALLNDLGITKVFDLGASILFDTARRIVDAADPARGGAGDFIGADFLDADQRDKTLAELADSPVAVLRQVGAAAATKLNEKLGISTIRELAAWPAYRAARAIINDAYGLTPALVADFERPDDLIPIARRYATERLQYDLIVFDRVLDRPKPDTASARRRNVPMSLHEVGNVAEARSSDIVEAGAIDIGAFASAAFNARPALGAVISYRQSWFPHGLALGHLLHSMALAPGESTRIAMVDWNRSVRAHATDDTIQSEEIIASVGRTRAMSEVTRAVAHEVQTGFSKTTSDATQEQGSLSWGAAGIVPLVPAVGSVGGSSAASTAHTEARGWASSEGTRDLNAEMCQNITDRTHQAANSVRNRRATAVTETSQQESERLSTRVVTNYNHMHALTMQYFEVVQVYRVVVEMTRVTRCLFIPMKLVTFTQDVLRRYRAVIASVGLIPEARALSGAREGTLVVRAPSGQGGWDPSWLALAGTGIGDRIGAPGDPEIHLPTDGLSIYAIHGDAALMTAFDSVELFSRQGVSYKAPIEDNLTGVIHAGCIAKLPLSASIRTRDLQRIVMRRKAGQEAFTGTFTVGFAFDVVTNDKSASDRVEMPWLFAKISVDVSANADSVTIFTLAHAVADADLIEHLEENALHYSSAIWRAIDAATMTTLLTSYDFGGRRLIELIDPVPVTVTGNYVVFRLYGGEEASEWSSFLTNHNLVLPMPLEDLVPLPSGGVFAEAVLGRSNAAEKLDISRFWNWQDSPIPILPPEINPLTAGGKANDATPKTANLESPIVNIVNAPALPDPVGLGPVYSALSNGNMFRDMSGLAQTAALAGTTMGAAQTGAGQAMVAAGAAQQVAAKLFTDVAQMAIQAAMAANGIPSMDGGPTGGGASALPQTPTNLGAALGAAQKIDKAEAAAGNPNDWAPYPGGSTGEDDGSLTPPPLVNTPDDPNVAVQPRHERAILHGTTPTVTPRPTTPPASLNRKVRVFSHYPGTSDPVPGLYEIYFGSGERWGGGPFYITPPASNVGELDITLPAGSWQVTGRIMASSTTPVPVNVAGVPGLAPFSTAVSHNPVPFNISDSLIVKHSARLVDLVLQAVVKEVSKTHTFELTKEEGQSNTTSAEVRAGVESEMNALVGSVTAKGELAAGISTTVSGSLTAGQSISVTIQYGVIAGFVVRKP